MSSGFRDAYFCILFLPFVMMSVSCASDIPCTSALVKSWAPIFLPIAEPVPSAPWQPAHFDLNRSAALCACADKERLRTTASAVAKENTLKLILFIFKLHLGFRDPTLERQSIYKLSNIALFLGGGCNGPHGTL